MRESIEELESKIRQLQSEKEFLNRKLHESELSSDEEIFDLVNGEIQNLYRKGDWKNLYKMADKIAGKIKAKRTVALDEHPLEIMAEAANEKPGFRFPGSFQLGMFIRRGTNLIIGAPSGVGKTTLAAQMAYDDIMFRNPGMFFSCEMTPAQVWTKLIQCELKYTHNIVKSDIDIMNSIKSKNHIYDISAKFIEKSKKFMIVVESDGFTASDIVTQHERGKEYLGEIPSKSYVDYIQILRPEPNVIKSQKKDQITEASRILASRAKMTGSSFVILSQLNSEGKFRESASIMDDTGLGLIVHRDIDESTGDWKDEIKLIINKSRFSGRRGSTLKVCPNTGLIEMG